jgi:hypothetical protein
VPKDFIGNELNVGDLCTVSLAGDGGGSAKVVGRIAAISDGGMLVAPKSRLEQPGITPGTVTVVLAPQVCQFDPSSGLVQGVTKVPEPAVPFTILPPKMEDVKKLMGSKAN